nr:hypothetical protein GCM10020063_094320 [Dactylosporangium thailandense]
MMASVLLERIRIRTARRRDVDSLKAAFPDEHPELIDEHLASQEAATGLFRVAWRRRRPVGRVFLRLDEAEEEPLRKHLPGVPVLSQLRVARAYQNQGIGTQLIMNLERAAARRARTALALGVGLDNEDALRLYLRLGFREWDYGIVSTRAAPEGCRPEFEDCIILFKTLPHRVRATHADAPHCPSSPASRLSLGRFGPMLGG